MDTSAEAPEGNQSPNEGTVLVRLASWVLDQLGLNADGLRVFTDSLLKAFQPGFPLHHPSGGEWFATLDAIDPEDKQVAALVRLSRRRPLEPREVRRGTVAVEERGRKLFAQPASTNLPTDADLLVTYPFLLLFSLEENLKLFREFAGNEIGRLRVKPEEAKKA